MDKNELERRLEAAEKQNLGLLDEIKNLKAQLAEMQDEPEIPDFPTFKASGEESWHINNLLDVSTPGIASGTVCDFNFFHTEVYAKEFAKKCKLIAMMLHCKWYLCPDYVPDFKNSKEEKYYVYYDACSSKYTADFRYVTTNNEVFFDTNESAKKCADWINKHWSGCDD